MVICEGELGKKKEKLLEDLIERKEGRKETLAPEWCDVEDSAMGL